ncbi:MAG: TonB family protein [Alphaproteobacteria bacterium]|nr:TonB family protein [Alphaproteobacteria bacterium]
MRPLEALVFLPLAGGLHLALWAMAPAGFGASTTNSGALGRNEVTLTGASPALAALSRTWRQPPQVTTNEPALLPPAPPTPEGVIIADQAPPSAPRSVAGLAPVLPMATSPDISVEKPVQTTVQTQAPAQPKAFSSPPDIRQTPLTDKVAPRLSPPRLVQVPLPDVPAYVDTTPAAKPPEVNKTPPSRSVPAQTASGGGAAQKLRSGRNGQDAVQSQKQAARNALQAQWGAQIQSRVRRKLIYPRGVSGTGSVRVSLTIERTGKLTALQLIKSSGIAEFDKAALGAIRRARRFTKAPGGLKAATYTFSLSLSFRP